MGSPQVTLLLSDLKHRLPLGRDNALRGSILAADLGVSERTLRQLVDEAIDHGILIGSVCSGGAPGYFEITDEVDLEVGTRHLISRAKAMHVRVARLRKAAARHFGEPVLRLFDLEEVTT